MRAVDLTSLAPGAVVRADVAIVGAGPAGIVLAEELDRHGVDVVVLEAGPRDGTSALDDLATETSSGAPRTSPVSAVRNSGVGGTSRTWSGRVAELDAEDFARRPAVPRSGWPIPRSDLDGHYRRASELVSASPADQPALQRRARLRHLPGTDELEPFLWTYSRTESGDFKRFGPDALRREDGVRCFTSARVREIVLRPSGTAFERLTAVGSDRHERHVEAAVAVLCAGGIENARLLLASAHLGAAGTGARHVGRYLMDHPRGEIAVFDRRAAPRAQALFGTLHRRGPKGRITMTPGLAVSSAAQRRHGLLQCALWVSPEFLPAAPGAMPRPLSGAMAVARSLDPRPGPQLIALRHRASPVRRTARVGVHGIVEQVPDPDSRVTLGAELDPWGTRVPHVHWRMDPLEKETVRWTALALVRYCRERGMPVPVVAPWVLDDGPLRLPDVAHPIGTTRMSESPADGVVDRDGRVFGVAGLYVCGSSVFPTSGHVNPTLTIVALATRLAGHLRGVLGERRTR